MSITNKNISVLDKLVKSEELLVNNSESNKNSQLLLELPKENLEILKKIGLDHHLDINQANANKINGRSTLSKLYNSKVYLGEEIKLVCNLYDLKFVVAAKYKGLLSEEVPKVILDFIEKNSIEVPDRNDPEKMVKKSSIDLGYGNFFVLAPTEEFLKTSIKKSSCTLFYRETGEGRNEKACENQKFIEVYSWGKNYSSLRMFNHIYNLYDYNTNDMSERTFGIILTFLFFIFLIAGVITSCFMGPLILCSIVSIILFFLINSNQKHFEKWNQQDFSNRH